MDFTFLSLLLYRLCTHSILINSSERKSQSRTWGLQRIVLVQRIVLAVKNWWLHLLPVFAVRFWKVDLRCRLRQLETISAPALFHFDSKNSSLIFADSLSACQAWLDYNQDSEQAWRRCLRNFRDWLPDQTYFICFTRWPGRQLLQSQSQDQFSSVNRGS